MDKEFGQRRGALHCLPQPPAALASFRHQIPDIIRLSGSAAVFAAEEFFDSTIRNDHTRRAYRLAVNQFLAWAEERELELSRIAPRDVGQYLSGLGKTTSIATRKQHLAALRHFFDGFCHAPRYRAEPSAFGARRTLRRHRGQTPSCRREPCLLPSSPQMLSAGAIAPSSPSLCIRPPAPEPSPL